MYWRAFIHILGCLCFLSFLLVFSCQQEDKENEIVEVPPEIRGPRISKDTLAQGFLNQDFLTYSFTFLNQFGEPGFSSEMDTIFLTFYDLRFDPPAAIPYIVSAQESSPVVQVTGGVVEAQVFTTCCAFASSTPCEPVEEAFEAVSYEVQFLNNLGFELPPDTIDFVVDCSF